MTRRLIVSYLAVTLVVLLLLEVPFAIFYAQRELERLTAATERDASVIATLYEDSLESGATSDPALAERYAERTGARVVVVDSAGISVVDTEESVPRDFSTRPEIAAALTGERASGTRPSETLDTDLLFVAVPVASSGVVHGALRLTLDSSEVDEHVHRFWWGLVAIGLVVLAAMALVGWLVAESVTMPLRRLIGVARRFGGGDLSVEPGPTNGPAELRELSDTMSAMAQQLSLLIEEQRAFVADASHQLRTPLTALRLRLENLQSSVNVDDAAEVEAAIEETVRLSALVTDLLQLARAERRRAAVPTDLAQTTAERVDTWTAVADTAGVQLQLHVEQTPAMVMAVPGAVEQILDNVLDNALSVTPADGVVTVAVRRAETGHDLVVTDHGPGLDDDAKAQARRRFWRGDTSRPGTGLGLAIASNLVEASGGSLDLRDADGGGLMVVVRFPHAPR